MASLEISSQVDEGKLSLEDAAGELYRLVEGAFDRESLSEEQRVERYAGLKAHLDAKGGDPAKP